MDANQYAALRTEENPSPDWGKVEAEFIEGIKSIRAIARDHGVSDAGVRKHARKAGWVRRPTSYVVGGANCALAPCPRCGIVLEIQLLPARKRLIAEPAP